MTAKPTVQELGLDPAALAWRRSGDGDGAIEIAFASQHPAGPGWVLMRVAGDPDERVLVFDRNEWECFLDGARNGEFDAAAGPASSPAGPAGAAAGPAGAAAGPDRPSE